MADQWLFNLFSGPAQGPDPVRPSLVVGPNFVAPAAPVDGPRHFYRCTGCLDVCTVPEPLPLSRGYTVTACGTCGQLLEYMGRAGAGGRLVSEHERCACDERCTSARGPLCVCKCKGANHGAGLRAVIRVVVDRGPVPVVVMPSQARAAKLLAQYQTFNAARARMRVELDALLDRKFGAERRSSGYLPPADYSRLTRLQFVNRKLSAARTHLGRMKLLAAVAV